MATRSILCIGAHPDDNELSVGGTAAKFRARGDAVRFVSVTNGDKGHFYDAYKADPSKPAARRGAERGGGHRGGLPDARRSRRRGLRGPADDRGDGALPPLLRRTGPR